MIKVATKNKTSKNTGKFMIDEPLTREEERAIEKGRLAYMAGDWKEWAEIKHGLERSDGGARRKRS